VLLLLWRPTRRGLSTIDSLHLQAGADVRPSRLECTSDGRAWAFGRLALTLNEAAERPRLGGFERCRVAVNTTPVTLYLGNYCYILPINTNH